MFVEDYFIITINFTASEISPKGSAGFPEHLQIFCFVSASFAVGSLRMLSSPTGFRLLLKTFFLA